MIALVPVAGYATRLYPLTKDTAKAMLLVAGKPMIEHVFEKIAELKDISRIVIVSNHRFFHQFSDWANGYQKNFSIPILVLDDGTTSEQTRLGAIGDAQFAIEKAGIREDLVWVSGDNLFSFSLQPMRDYFKSQKADVISCFDVKTLSEAKKFGVLKLDSNHRVVEFVEKPDHPKSTFASIGIYFFLKDTVPLFKTYLDEKNSPDKPGEFIQWLYKKKPVNGFVFDQHGDEWFDIGTPDVLETVRKRFQDKLEQ